MTAEQRFTQIEESLLAQTRLVERFERDTEQRLRALEAGAEHHEAEMAEFRSTVARVLKILERFVAGQSGPNGH